MRDSMKEGLRIAGSALFVLGLLLFLIETRSRGVSLESFTLTLSSDAASIIGAAAALLAAAGLLILHLRDRRKTSTKHPWRHA